MNHPRDLHPVAWWLWAIGLAVAASLTTNPLILLMLIGVAALVVSLRRSEQPWGQSFRLYVWLGVAIVVIRVAFRLVFGGWFGGRVLLDLPSVPLPDWVAGITLLGPVYAQAVLFALYDGLRLATIVICVGAANSLANPKRLLRSVPPALYEIGTALVVAVSVLPQFADSMRRVRAAQALRAGETGRVGRLRRLLVPVLEDALERSLALAAGMDARGYGRAGDATRAQRRTTGALMLVGLVGICVGTYAVLDHTAPRVLALPMLAVGVLAAVAGLRSAGRRVERTRYRPDPWRWPELAVTASGVIVGGLGWWISEHQVAVAYPALDAFPTISLAALAAGAVALLGALCSPPQARTTTTAAVLVREEVAA
ncbi:cobalt ABC transporter permease [Nocardioides sp. Root1257]|uniref:energy-coupling factor transporter transmembrane component T n=1 Tax=unclassified Nocardioides TaxID=2615069 RepID=UPI000700DBB0|nr:MULTISPECIES: energy-coupling factor transporter transmembrane component T [unclassified Nocardioides]KQW53733.1 cobalt ABC transporter permease [Nocardioides sp. Root1257]KRC56419.1 cobalt ABC transporter permease [Nocardioides sp. Root224]